MAAGEVRRIFRQEEGFDFFEKSLFALSTAKPSGGSDHERCERLLVNQDPDFEDARHKFVFSVWAENWESLKKTVWASLAPEVELGANFRKSRGLWSGSRRRLTSSKVTRC